MGNVSDTKLTRVCTKPFLECDRNMTYHTQILAGLYLLYSSWNFRERMRPRFVSHCFEKHLGVTNVTGRKNCSAHREEYRYYANK